MTTLSVRIKIDPDDRDRDIVTLENGEAYHFCTWLRGVELAVRLLRRALSTPTGRLTSTIYNQAAWGRAFLDKCGVKTEEDFQYLESGLLPKLKLPPDSPRAARRCRICGSRIWGRESLLTGIGSECRHGGARTARPSRGLPLSRPPAVSACRPIA